MGRIALLIGLLLMTVGCNPASGTGRTTAGAGTRGTEATTTTFGETTTPRHFFPVTVSDAAGEVTIDASPQRIVSLSSTGTEMLYAIGAGDQVIAVDEFSTHPEEAPRTSLSGFTPNLEALLDFEPDLVVISFDPGELKSALQAVEVPSLFLPTASTLDDSYRQLEVLGAATGHIAEAAGVVAGMQSAIEEVLASAQVPQGISFYHEVDATLYSASSASFLGQIYAILGLENIADQAEDPAGFGFPQLSPEYVVAADPDLIFLGDVDFGVTPESIAERPGWGGMTAVTSGAIVGLDSYLASNWGPSVVDLLLAIADAIAQHAPTS
jgi:iron complex transport system substrate-binding protein